MAGTTKASGVKAASAPSWGPEYFVGREVEIYAPPGHMIAMAYALPPRPSVDSDDEDNLTQAPVIGAFTCRLLSTEFDSTTGELVAGVIEYRQGRKYIRRDLVGLRGCAISCIERVDDADIAGDDDA
jgi:hypothetical protein